MIPSVPRDAAIKQRLLPLVEVSARSQLTTHAGTTHLSVPTHGMLETSLPSLRTEENTVDLFMGSRERNVSEEPQQSYDEFGKKE